MKTAQVNGIRLAYKATGEGTPIVLLHGFPFNHSMWQDQTQAIRDAGRLVITPDLRGHGESPVGPVTSSVTGASAATMEQMAQDVAGLLDELNIERAVIGGLSMGGYVAFAFYRLFPERVRALILADTRPQADTDDGRRGREEMAAQILDSGMGIVVEKMVPRLLAESTFARQPETVARVRQMIETTKPDGAVAALKGMAARADQTELLQHINRPTLIIVGSEDKLTPVGDARVMHQHIEGSRLEIIEEAGHVSNMEQPAEFNRVVKSFLGSL